MARVCRTQNKASTGTLQKSSLNWITQQLHSVFAIVSNVTCHIKIIRGYVLSCVIRLLFTTSHWPSEIICEDLSYWSSLIIIFYSLYVSPVNEFKSEKVTLIFTLSDKSEQYNLSVICSLIQYSQLSTAVNSVLFRQFACSQISSVY